MSRTAAVRRKSLHHPVKGRRGRKGGNMESSQRRRRKVETTVKLSKRNN